MKTKLLISVDELADRLDQVSLIDTRPVHQFSVGHLPNALSLDLFYLSLNDTRIEPLTSFMWTIATLFSKRGVDFNRETEENALKFSIAFEHRDRSTHRHRSNRR